MITTKILSYSLKGTGYIVGIVLLIQIIVAILNYTEDWKEKDKQKKNNSGLDSTEIIDDEEEINNSEYEDIDSDEEENTSLNPAVSSQNASSNILSTNFDIKAFFLDTNSGINKRQKNKKNDVGYILSKISLYISILPLSVIYLFFKMTYYLIRVSIYSLFDYCKRKAYFWLYEFPENWEDEVLYFLDNYIWKNVKFVYNSVLYPILDFFYTRLSEYCRRTFTVENYEKWVDTFEEKCTELYYQYGIPMMERIEIYGKQFKDFSIKWIKYFAVEFYLYGKEIIHTIVLFTLDFFEDVQVAWSGIKWFGVFVAQPAANFLQEIFLITFVRPLAYSFAILKVFYYKVVVRLMISIFGLIVILPALLTKGIKKVYQVLYLYEIGHTLFQFFNRFILYPLYTLACCIGQKIKYIFTTLIPNIIVRLWDVIQHVYTIICMACQSMYYISIQLGKKILIEMNRFINYLFYVRDMVLSLSKRIYENYQYLIHHSITAAMIHYCIILPYQITRLVYFILLDNVIFVWRITSIVLKEVGYVLSLLGGYLMKEMKVVAELLFDFLKFLYNALKPTIIQVSEIIYYEIQIFILKQYTAIQPWILNNIDMIKMKSVEIKDEIVIMILSTGKILEKKIKEIIKEGHDQLIILNKNLRHSYSNKKLFNETYLKTNNNNNEETKKNL